MKYNTQKEKLKMPEYGRNIKDMIDHCIEIEDREERNRCANTIIDVMGNMFPHLRDINNFKHILWDHLAIISDFRLDIDYPYEVIDKEELYASPGLLSYSRPTMKYRHYGKIIERLIDIASEMEDGDKKDHLIKLILNQMKRSYIQWNKRVEDDKIYEDLTELSNGKLKVSSDNYQIPNVAVTPNRTKLRNIKHRRRR